jgi:hypothetical protein
VCHAEVADKPPAKVGFFFHSTLTNDVKVVAQIVVRNDNGVLLTQFFARVQNDLLLMWLFHTSHRSKKRNAPSLYPGRRFKRHVQVYEQLG